MVCPIPLGDHKKTRDDNLNPVPRLVYGVHQFWHVGSPVGIEFLNAKSKLHRFKAIRAQVAGNRPSLLD